MLEREGHSTLVWLDTPVAVQSPRALDVSRRANGRFEQGDALRNDSLFFCLLRCCHLGFVALSLGLFQSGLRAGRGGGVQCRSADASDVAR